MNNKKKSLILSILLILGLIIVTVGVTYAFFNYTKEGSTENTLTTGTITFLYTEVTGVGKGISIDDAFPISDEQGKAQTGEGKVFDFKITSDTFDKTSIPYEVTARKKKDSTLDEKAVKLYLTRGETEEEVLLDNYSNLTQTTKVLETDYVEKTIYKDKVPANTKDYEETFRLRMWIDEEIDFSGVEQEDGTIEYPYNDKTFTITVNVYANAKTVTEEDIINDSKAEIVSLSVEGTEVTKIEDETLGYDYETTLPEGTTSTTINVETLSEDAKVTVEKLDALAYNSSNVKRLSAKKTLDLTSGDNYFKITVTSVNGEVENEYTLKIKVPMSAMTLKDAIFTKYSVVEAKPTLTTSSLEAGDADGLYKSTETNSGDPTYYFRGNVTNNYVDFAGFTWRIVRINEDGTIRIIMNGRINGTNYVFNTVKTSKDNMYYSNSNTAKIVLENWYSSNIASNENYSNRVATGDYYCEQAKIAYSDVYAAESGTDMTVYSSYTPDFKCSTDAHGKGIVNSNIGLLSYDEVVHAGGYYDKWNSNYYLYSGGYYWWFMDTCGWTGSYSSTCGWYVDSNGYIQGSPIDYPRGLRAVLNLKANTKVSGEGTSESHWVVQ